MDDAVAGQAAAFVPYLLFSFGLEPYSIGDGCGKDGPYRWGFWAWPSFALYGVVVAKQPLPFGRAYAAYGGVFVVMSILWALVFDGFRPDRWDLAGALVILLGVVVMIFGPRG